MPTVQDAKHERVKNGFLTAALMRAISDHLKEINQLKGKMYFLSPGSGLCCIVLYFLSFLGLPFLHLSSKSPVSLNVIRARSMGTRVYSKVIQ